MVGARLCLDADRPTAQLWRLPRDAWLVQGNRINLGQQEQAACTLFALVPFSLIERGVSVVPQRVLSRTMMAGAQRTLIGTSPDGIHNPPVLALIAEIDSQAVPSRPPSNGKSQGSCAPQLQRTPDLPLGAAARAQDGEGHPSAQGVANEVPTVCVGSMTHGVYCVRPKMFLQRREKERERGTLPG